MNRVMIRDQNAKPKKKNLIKIDERNGEAFR